MRLHPVAALGLAALVMLLWVGLLSPGVYAQRGARVGESAPELTGGPWINSEPTHASGTGTRPEKLRGRVVFVEFWTYGCINCQNVIPQLRAWHGKYEKEGLTIVGVHTPEFFWEKPYDKVAAAVKKFGIRYAVVQDNDWAIWKRFGIRAWPTALLIDRKGIVRFSHIGEGAYEEIEAEIQRLLAERG